jgi:hypothetical protein
MELFYLGKKSYDLIRRVNIQICKVVDTSLSVSGKLSLI